MLNAEIVRSDGNPQNIVHPFMLQLVSNLSIFKRDWPLDKIKKVDQINEMVDDSSDNNLVYFEEILADYSEERNCGQAFECLVHEKYLYSSSRLRRDNNKIKGYDRPEQVKYDNCISFLKDATEQEPKIGYKSAKADASSGFVRFTPKDVLEGSEPAYFATIVKPKGNGRFFMKKLVNEGDEIYVRMQVRFHPVDSEPDYWLRTEAAVHSADAKSRTNQNDPEKFSSSVAAGDKKYITLRDQLEKWEVNYDNYFDQPDWPTLTAIGGMTNGLDQWEFKRYGFTNVCTAMEICKEILKLPHQHKNDNTIFHNTLFMIASMVQSFTMDWKQVYDESMSHGSARKKKPTKTQYFTDAEIKEFFIDFFNMKNKSNDKFSKRDTGLQLRQLTTSGTTKSLEFIACQIFWQNDALPVWYMTKHDKDIIQITPKCDSVIHFLKKIGKENNIGDRLLRRHAEQLVTVGS